MEQLRCNDDSDVDDTDDVDALFIEVDKGVLSGPQWEWRLSGGKTRVREGLNEEKTGRDRKLNFVTLGDWIAAVHRLADTQQRR